MDIQEKPSHHPTQVITDRDRDAQHQPAHLFQKVEYDFLKRERGPRSPRRDSETPS
jgi:hypothetical protein